MVDVRKTVMMLVIALLYTFFVNAFIEAIHEEPRYEEFCDYERVPKPYRVEPLAVANRTCPDFADASSQEEKECRAKEGYIQYDYDAYDCPVSFNCNTCKVALDAARKTYNFFVFWVSAIFALVAILGGFLLPKYNTRVGEMVGSAFIFGGLATLFVGTARSYGDLDLILRPIILFAEMVIVIVICYLKFKK